MHHPGYPAPYTLGQVLEAGRFVTVEAHWRRIGEIIVDGKRLYDTHLLLRTNSPHELRYAQKFSEVMLAAHALARLEGARWIAIDTGEATPHERPDLRVTIDGEQIGLEVAEIHPNAHATNALAQLNVDLGDALDAQPALRPDGFIMYVSPRAGRHGNLVPTRKLRNGLRNAVLSWLASGNYRSQTEYIVHRRDWPGFALGYEIVSCLSPQCAGYVKVKDGAFGFDPEGMTLPALRMIDRKCRLGVSYDRSRPLWLVLGITQDTGLYTASIHALHHLAQRALDIGPFDRVIVHDGNSFLTRVA
jgi:hypothetical protein